MKILIDLTSLSDNFSGIERYALNISKQMIFQDKCNEYILLFKNYVHSDFDIFRNYDNVHMKIIKGKNRLVFNQIRLPYNLYKIEAERYMFFAFPSPILFHKRGIINTIHDITCWDFPETMKKLSKWYFRISIRNALRVSEKILTVSQFSQKRIEEKLKYAKEIKVVYNGVSEVFENFKYDKETDDYIKEKFNINGSYIMCLGTLEPRKNINLLINAFIELKKELTSEIKLVLVGRKGWKLEEIFGGVSREILDDIVVTGFVEDKYLPYIYLNARLFVFPSIYEGFGIPILEASKMRTTILTSDIDVFKEICEKKSYMFKNNSKNDLKNKIKEIILKDNNIEKNNIYEKYRWSDESKKILDILR